MIRDNGISYYCNLASPFVLDKEALKYIDYDLDVKVFQTVRSGYWMLMSMKILVNVGIMDPRLIEF